MNKTCGRLVDTTVYLGETEMELGREIAAEITQCIMNIAPMVAAIASECLRKSEEAIAEAVRNEIAQILAENNEGSITIADEE